MNMVKKNIETTSFTFLSEKQIFVLNMIMNYESYFIIIIFNCYVVCFICDKKFIIFFTV